MTASASWSVELWEPLGGVIYAVADANNREHVPSLTEGDTFSFTVDGRNPAVPYLKELITDVVVYRNSEKIYRGRLMNADHNIDASGHTVTVSSVDYKQLLKKRFLYVTDAYVKGPRATVDLEARAWELINHTQTRSASWDLGITRGLGQTVGINTNRLFEAGTSVKEAIDSLAEATSGLDVQSYFEWWIDPNLTFQVAPGQRGKQFPDFLLDYGGSVLSVGTSLDPTSYANHFEVIGTGSLRSATNSSDVGRWPGAIFEEYVNDSNLETTTEVDSRALYLATYHGQLDYLRSYQVEVSPLGWPGPADLWIGDYVTLDLTAGGLGVKTTNLRIIDMAVSIDESGMERIGLSVGYVPSLRYRDLHRVTNFVKDFRNRLTRDRALWHIQLRNKLWAAWASARKRHGPKHAITKAALRQFYDAKRNLSKFQAGSSVYDKLFG